MTTDCSPRIGLSLVAVFGLVTASPQPASAGGIITRDVKPRPSFPDNERILHRYFGCYSIYDGSPLDCRFTLDVLGLASPPDVAGNNGGHSHSPGRPLSLNNAPLEYGADANPAPYGVTGSALSTPPRTSAQVKHVLPEVAGRIATDALVETPYGWSCVSRCYTRTSWRFNINYDVQVRELEELPSPGANGPYTRVRAPDSNHLDSVAFFGTRFAIQYLKLVAENYSVLSGKTLSVNDISLLKGGLFDINADWAMPHKSHRDGKDADINRGNIGCDQDHALRLAVDMLLNPVTTPNGNKRSALLCESCKDGTKCRKHVDLEP